MTELEMLDETLKWFALDYRGKKDSPIPIVFQPLTISNFWNLITSTDGKASHLPNLNAVEYLIFYRAVFEKLTKDGYLIKEDVGYSGREPKYSISYDGLVFAKRKTFYWTNFWERVKEFIKSYWVVIALLVTVVFNIRAILKEKSSQEDILQLQQQLQQVRDSLHFPKSH